SGATGLRPGATRPKGSSSPSARRSELKAATGSVLRDTRRLAPRVLWGVPRHLGHESPQVFSYEVGSSVKRLISSKLAVCLIAASGALAALPAWAETKIGVVDPARLLERAATG